MVGFIYNHYDFQIDAISQGTYLPSRDNLGAFLVSSIDKVKTEEIKVLGRGSSLLAWKGRRASRGSPLVPAG